MLGILTQFSCVAHKTNLMTQHNALTDQKSGLNNVNSYTEKVRYNFECTACSKQIRLGKVRDIWRISTNIF